MDHLTFCPTCGNQFPSGAAFCGSCGRAVDSRIDLPPPLVRRPLWADGSGRRKALPLALVGLAVAAAGLWLLMSRDTPARAAEQFVNAIASVNQDVMNELTCDDERMRLQNFLLSNAPRSTLTDMEFRTQLEREDSADVLVTGRVQIGIIGLAQTTEMRSVFHMKRERGRWKYCGDSPAPVADIEPGASARRDASRTLSPQPTPATSTPPPTIALVNLREGEPWIRDAIEVRVVGSAIEDRCSTRGRLAEIQVRNTGSQTIVRRSLGRLTASRSGQQLDLWGGSPPISGCYSELLRELTVIELRSGATVLVGARAVGGDGAVDFTLEDPNTNSGARWTLRPQ